MDEINGLSNDPAEISPEKENGEFPSEWMVESQETYTEEQRQNLYHQVLKMNAAQKVRLAMMGNREARDLLIHDPSKMISLAVLRNPKINENEIIKYAQQKNMSQEVILAIAKNERWMKKYEVKLALVSNPKTSLTVAIKFLSHIHERDLKSLARDKNISPVLSRAAHETALKKRG